VEDDVHGEVEEDYLHGDVVEDDVHEQGATWQTLKEAFRQQYRMSIRTSTTLRNCKRLDRLERKSATICRSFQEFTTKSDDKISRPTGSAHSRAKR